MDNGASSYRRFLDGDKAAFEEIVNELFRPLVFFILGYVGNVHDAEDVAIDAFSDLIVNPRRYNFKTSLKTYLFMIGKSRAVDLLRHRKTAVTADLSEAEDLADRDELESTVIRNEEKRALARAVRDLPPDMRAAVHLVYFEDMTYDEAAKIMKKTRKQVDNLICRAKSELKKALI
ncbi:MAG: sigma-70 family RNA polymerase sigma factor [Clostridia bacterium]|nr:sigma-70 family RNA polymerase sigma factor [Clostridia bacterium]